jgi:hypothetical protein
MFASAFRLPCIDHLPYLALLSPHTQLALRYPLTYSRHLPYVVHTPFCNISQTRPAISLALLLQTCPTYRSRPHLPGVLPLLTAAPKSVLCPHRVCPTVITLPYCHHICPTGTTTLLCPTTHNHHKSLLPTYITIPPLPQHDTSHTNSITVVKLPTVSSEVVQTSLQDHSEVHVRSAVDECEKNRPTSLLVCVGISAMAREAVEQVHFMQQYCQ